MDFLHSIRPLFIKHSEIKTFADKDTKMLPISNDLIGVQQYYNNLHLIYCSYILLTTRLNVVNKTKVVVYDTNPLHNTHN